MRLFLRKILIGILLLAVLATALDYCISSGLSRMEDYRFQTWTSIVKGGNEHNVIIMGNSRGFSHFDPEIIDSMCGVDSYCLGIGGYPINVQMARWNIYKNHNQMPEAIIYNVDPMTFAQIKDVRHQHESEAFFPLVYDQSSRKELKKIGYGMGELYVPLYRYLGYQQVIKNGLFEFLGLRHYTSWPSYKGYRPETGPWNGEELKKRLPAPSDFDKESMAMFEDYLSECKQKGIKVVMVFSPLYSEAVEKITNIHDWREYYSQLSQKYGCCYLDYLDNPICRDTSNFRVSFHLNEKAAQEFTTILCEDLNSNNYLN